MSLAIIGQAAVLFAVTNVDDVVILSLFFALGAGHSGTTNSIVLGQYLGFVAILTVSVAAAVGATFLPTSAVAYLGLLPLALGLKEAREAWKARRDRHMGSAESDKRPDELSVWSVAVVSLANGGDNIGVYVPVFATLGYAGMSTYVIVFLILVAVTCVAGKVLVSHRVVASALSRWAHVLLPVVLIALGLVILIEGGAFGL